MNAFREKNNSAAHNQRSLKRLVRALSLSGGQFSLILACCNYESLQDKIVASLVKESSLKIDKLVLPEKVNTLYTTIKCQLERSPEQPSALTIFGLDKVENIDDLLLSTNQVRDEFRKTFNFPIVLWVTDEIVAKLIKLAPDFKSWAAATIKFELLKEELIELLLKNRENFFKEFYNREKSTANEREESDRFVFGSSTNRIGYSYPALQEPASANSLCQNFRQEIEQALKDLGSLTEELELVLKTDLEFILGWDDYASGKLDSALAHYQKSFSFWEKERERLDLLEPEKPSYPKKSNRYLQLEKQGIIYFYIALCYRRKARSNPLKNSEEWKRAGRNFKKSIQIFERANLPELVAEVITLLAEGLQQLEAWEELQFIAKKGIELHFQYCTHKEVARDYGFLAEVALANYDWQEADRLASLALEILARHGKSLPAEGNLYRLLLGRSLKKIGDDRQALELLELSRKTEKEALQQSNSTPSNKSPKLYLDILNELRSLYYEKGQYLKAFRLKKEQRQVEHQYGMLAFIGAAQLQCQQQVGITDLSPTRRIVPEEIAASSRQQDIKNLLERISRDDYKLIIIHGLSGVGKSSLVNAGLVPTMESISINARNIVPVATRVYSDWMAELDSGLKKRLKIEEEKQKSSEVVEREDLNEGIPTWGKETTELSRTSLPRGLRNIIHNIKNLEVELLEQLQKNAENNWITILIFDQFEEFFFTVQDREKRTAFYNFLQKCFKLPFVKIILSMREDYLHYLLECDRLEGFDAVGHNILDKKNRYSLSNFSLSDAYKVIECLTKRAKFDLEPALIDTLVNALADEKEEIRPIELQVVGAQLQDQQPPITTLAQFKKLGTNSKQAKEQLVRNFIEQVIKDCGLENEEITLQVLFSLTDEKFTRPRKSKEEIIFIVGQKMQIFSDRLERNFYRKDESNPEGDGVTQAIAYGNTGRNYQQDIYLILEILVDSGLVFVWKEFSEERYQLIHDYLVYPIRKRFGLEKRLRQAEAEKYKAEADTKISQEKLNRVLQQRLAAAIVGVCLFGCSTLASVFFWQRAESRKYLAEIEALTATSEALYFSNHKLDALLESLKVGFKWKELKKNLGRGRTLSETKFRIAASLQQAVYGVKEKNRLEGHLDVIWGVVFNHDGNIIASGGADKTVKLWSPDGTLLKTLKGHEENITRLSFSPTENLLASASRDKTIKLWNIDRELCNLSLKAANNKSSQEQFTTDIFNTNSSIIPAKIGSYCPVNSTEIGKYFCAQQQDFNCSIQARPLILEGHTNTILAVSFSPDGRTLASASLDKTIKIWSHTGVLLRTIETEFAVTWVSFNVNSDIVAGAGDDGIVRLWNLESGKLLAVLQHSTPGSVKKVYTVNFSPDGKSIVTGGEDLLIKLWSWSGKKAVLETTMKGHSSWVLNAIFSPDGETIASSSADNTIRLWNREGKELKILEGHGDKVTQVNFSLDGKILASASYDKTVRLWSINDLELQILQGHKDRVLDVAFSADGKLLASGARDNTIKLWTRQGVLLQTLQGHSDRVKSVAFSPTAKILASGSYDNTVKLWYLQSDLPCDESSISSNNLEFVDYPLFREHLIEAKMLSFLLPITYYPLPKSVKFLALFIPPMHPLFSSPCSVIVTLQGHTDSLLDVSFSPDGKLIASASKDKTIRLWSIDGTLLKTLKGHTKWVNSVSFSPDGEILASASEDGMVHLWSLNSTLVEGKYAEIDGLLLKRIKAHHNVILDVSFSPDGKRIATAGYDNRVKLWDLQGKLLATLLKGASDSVTSVSFHPGEQIVASASYDGKIKLWSTDGALLKIWSGHEDSAMSVSFSPDGTLLASGSYDTTVMLWNLDLDDLLVRGCNWVEDYLRTNPNLEESDRLLSLCQDIASSSD